MSLKRQLRWKRVGFLLAAVITLVITGLPAAASNLFSEACQYNGIA
ncbi:MAG: hypothetical protein HY305_04940 [Sphingobacteriales bacterium]|nr:hypothetical protein [Sphingobacteriales bacterium]